MSKTITLKNLSLEDAIKIPDPLRTKITNRYTAKPILFPDIYKLYIKHRSLFWIPEEIEFEKDLSDWNDKLNDNERDFIKHIIAFFASSDKVVSDNIQKNFMADVQLDEAIWFYQTQSQIETIHSVTYSNMLDVYVKDSVDKDNLTQAVTTIPCIGKKIKWAEKWMNYVSLDDNYKEETKDSSINDDLLFVYRLVVFIIIEGVFFSGSFCSIYWLQSKNLMKMLSKANNFIARDEGMHTVFGQYLYKTYIKNKLTDKQIHDLISEAVNIEIEFITQSLPCKLVGMNSDDMIKYIKFVANNLLKDMNHSILYTDIVINPFEFMYAIALTNKTDFFHDTPTEYSHEIVTNKKRINYDDL